MEISAKTEVTIAELAVVFGITSRRVRQLAQDGVISPVEKGKYQLGPSIQAFLEFRAKRKSMTQEETERLTAETIIKKAKANIAVMEAKEIQGKMHRAEVVAAMTEDFICTIGEALMALPDRLAVDVANTITAAEASIVIREEVYKVMGELANYRFDAERYEERVREGRNWDAIARSINADEGSEI